MLERYDVVVVGAGHAGSEAAAAAANMGCKTLLVTMDMTKIAQMSCNPAMGGIAKGQIVREIDALGGYSGIVTDKSMIQFRMLNKSKGPALWSPRAQNDRTKFSVIWREMLENTANLDFWQDTVVELIIENNRIKGIKTRFGVSIYSKTVILTTGTFENGLMHVGRTKVSGGRASDPPSTGISKQLSEYNFRIGRMKTGTPARIDGRTIDFSEMTEQKGDFNGDKFSFLDYKVDYSNHVSCWITFTNDDVHAELQKGLADSPMYNGTIQSIGPRYCPSIEDKIHTFAEKSKHQLFLEPEGTNTFEYYLNGFSSSLPLDIQLGALHKIKGLEKAKIFRPGYAIEYDFYDPLELKHSLETKKIDNLFFAGQINGTTGYEEAGAQGIIAGINAALKIRGENEFVLTRDQAYIGVLIDDLVTKGVDEPYRMFTSRAEYRLLLRQDDADERLSYLAYDIGLANASRKALLDSKIKAKQEILNILKRESIGPDKARELLSMKGTSQIKQKIKVIELLKRPQLSIFDLIEVSPELEIVYKKLDNRANEVFSSAEVSVKYEGYIERERNLADKLKRLEKISIPVDLDYNKLLSISTEARQKLSKQLPQTIGEASRISGVSPADVSVLLLYMGR